MNILFVIDALEIGGAETFLMRLMEELSKHGHNLYIYTVNPQSDNPSFANYFLNETHAVRIHDPKQHGRLISFLFYKVNAVLKKMGYPDFYKKYLQHRKDRHFKTLLLEKYKIDIINSHLHSADVFTAYYFKPLLKRPHIITMQGCYESVIDTRNKEVIDRAARAITNCDGMTYVAEKNLEFLKLTKTSPPGILKKIYNGAASPDPSVFKKRKDFNISETDFVIGQVSRSIESKGMEIAIKAVESLFEQKDYKNIKLIIVGPKNEYYQKLKLKYSDKIFIMFPGSTYNSFEWIDLFDVGVLPTYFPSESCPSSIIEYIACGKPVISTTIGEIPDMISAGKEKAGFLISEKDMNGIPDTEKFISAIENYYLNKELYKKHSKLAFIAFEKFRIDTIMKEYLEVYTEVLIK